MEQEMTMAEMTPMMKPVMTPIRRVVTGTDEQGRSGVRWDSPSPQVHGSAVRDRGHTDFWVWSETPAPLGEAEDAGLRPDEFPGPTGGGHLRVVHWREKGDEPATSAPPSPFHESRARPGGRTWDRGGGNGVSSSAMHKTESVDYGIIMTGERSVLLDDGECLLKPGDIIVQVGAWHQWDSARLGCLMAFDMVSAKFVDGAVGLAQGNDPVLPPGSGNALPPGVKPTRRVVTIDREPGRSCVVSDGPSPDVRIDPARPGFALARIWVTDSTPAKIVAETLHLPHVLQPPPRGSTCRVETHPPDAAWIGQAGAAAARAYFASVGSPDACTASPQAPHPYMHRTQTLEFCCVLEGEIVLVLDTAEVRLATGDIAVVRGDNHAWSNRSAKPCVIAIAAHDGALQTG
jgi:mannose-6-phosphate isomerase-like protein (cupin superfamily)